MTTNSVVCHFCLNISRGVIRASHGRSLSASIYQSSRGLKQYQQKTVRLMYWRGRSFDRIKMDGKRSDFQEWNYRSEIFAFSRRLQENLDENTLRQIFTHPAYIEDFRANQIKFKLPEIYIKSNAELVLRGDTLLTDCVKPYLRYTFNKMPEDGIVAITNYLKSEDTLNDVANWIGCKDIILTKEYPPDKSTMANTVKALLAGIEKDLGYERARRFVVDMIVSYLNDKDILDDVWIIPNPRQTLNVILENSKMPSYEPRIIFQTGVRTTEACHIVGLYCNKKLLGSSPGESLDIAEECAALDSLKALFDLKESRRPFVYGEESESIDLRPYQGQFDSIQTYMITLQK